MYYLGNLNDETELEFEIYRNSSCKVKNNCLIKFQQKGESYMEYLGNLETTPKIEPRSCWIKLCGVNGNCGLNF